MRHIDVAERRARLGVRHRLVPTAKVDDDVAAIARSVVVLHATDPATVVLSALARMRAPSVTSVERALYEERTVLRMLAMRRTLFGVPVDLVPVVHAAASLEVAAKQRRLLVKLLEEATVPELTRVRKRKDRWLREVEERTLAALEARGEALANELSSDVPELAIQIPMNEGKTYAGKVGLSSRVLLVLAAEGRIVRGRARGGWTHGQHHWTATSSWLGADVEDVDVEAARAELAGRWLERFGPATVADLRWWTGWSLGQTRAALAAVETVAVDLDGTEGLVLAGDDEPVPAPEPWVALLPSLDPTTMGWQERSWYLGDHKPLVFDRNGNAGATVWADGRIVGGWAQRADGEVVTRVLEDVGRDASEAIDAAAGALEELLGDVRVTPRFPAPLDKQLRA